jgi:hypothetical protein
MRLLSLLRLIATLCGFAAVCFAGGPIAVGGPALGVDGQPFLWDLSPGPISYRVDSGPLSVNPSGTVVVDNANGLTRVQAATQAWSIPTAAIRYQYAGPIQAAGSFSGGDVTTVEQFNAVFGSCISGVQNPVIFDANGSMFDQLIGDPFVIDFAGPCAVNMSGKITGAFVALNGRFIDGVNDGKNNRELSSDRFDAALIHEFGHFSGLDHAQINLNCLLYGCSSFAETQGLPTMFPILLDPEQKTLSTDDQSWISKLYPNGSTAASYGTISGHVFFSDGKTPTQGVNVIARRIGSPANSEAIAVSVVSGFKFTGNPGQPITSHYLPCSPASQCPPNGFRSDNSAGSSRGSRDPQWIGYYELLVPAPGNYTIEVESINSSFSGGSRVGPVSPPLALPGGIPRFWKAGGTNHDDPYDNSSTVSVGAGATVSNIDIILEGTDATFDQFEDPGHSRLEPSAVDPLLAKDVEVLA